MGSQLQAHRDAVSGPGLCKLPGWLAGFQERVENGTDPTRSDRSHLPNRAPEELAFS